jgi:hypothetical protein
VTECPSLELWPQLAAGDLPEREAAALRVHADGCSACAGLLTDSRGLLAALARPAAAPEAARVQALMRAVEAPAPSRLGFLVPIAVAAGLIAIAVPLATRPSGELTPRGAELTWRQRAHAELRPLAAAAKPVSPGTLLPARAPLSVWYRNLETAAPLKLLAFVVDGAGEVHWVAPAWPEGQPTPAPAVLPRAEGAALMPESFVAEGAAAGDALLVTVVSDATLSVDTVEHAPPAQRRDPASLFPGALVWSAAVHLTPEAP